MLTQVSAQIVDGCLRDGPHSRIRIEAFSVQIEGNLEAPAFNIRQGIRKARVRTMQPYWHFGRPEIGVACRGPKKKYFLPRGENALAQQIRKNFGQPWAATENKCTRRNRIAVADFDLR